MTDFEKLVTALINGESVDIVPNTDLEVYLKACIDGSGTDNLPIPNSRMDILLYQLAERLSGGTPVVADATQTYMLVTQDGEEIPAVLVEEETLFTATANDIREGTVAATEEGVTVGTKNIPAYYATEGVTIVMPGNAATIPLPSSYNLYDYTKFQAIICVFNTNLSDSVSAEKVSINSKVYNVLSVDAISAVAANDDTSSIDLGITNDTDKMVLVRYMSIKEE